MLAQFAPSEPLRLQAKEKLMELGLPSAKAEEYKFTPIIRELEKHFNWSASSQPVASSDFPAEDAATLDAFHITIGNGTVLHLPEHTSSEFTVKSLADAARLQDPLLSNHLARYASFDQDPFACWNTAAWADGVLIEIPANKKVSKPILIHHYHEATHADVKSHARLLVVAQPGSEVTLVEQFHSSGSYPHFSNNVAEVVVRQNGRVNYYTLQDDAGQRYHVGLTQFHQERASRVNCFTFTLNGKLIRNNTQVVLTGEGCESHLYGLYLLQGQTLADNHTVVDHRTPNAFSNELYKGILDEHSRGVFNGKIYVRPDAQKTNAFQSNRNILLTDTATVHTKPQLEIWADDVKCSHGCTTGQLDEEALFYLRTRGINIETAKAMMLYAFAAEVVETIPHAGIRTYVDNLIGQRLHRNF
jgi:Fe-S cluster assembly protein SufD